MFDCQQLFRRAVAISSAAPREIIALFRSDTAFSAVLREIADSYFMLLPIFSPY